jgi:lantibiotic modifying enzyme
MNAGRAMVLLLLLATGARADDALDAACSIGDYLVATARREGDGVCWAQYEGPGPASKKDPVHFPVSLYSGSAGTGFFLLNLHRATGKKASLDAAAAAGRRLVAVAKPAPKGGVAWSATYARGSRSVPDGDGLGLYTGNAGIGLFLLRLFEATCDPVFRRGAAAAFERVLAEAVPAGDGLHWRGGATDIIGGEAGIGLALLEVSRVTGDAKYREAAEKAARWTIARAEHDGDRLRWKGFKPYDAGFSHGAAGIAFFLAALGDGSAVPAARFVEAAATPCGEGKDAGLLWRYYPGAPPAGKRNRVMNSWCHGAPGVVRLFVLLHARTGDPRYLRLAADGAMGVRDQARLAAGAPFYWNPTYCCGAAGCIDGLCDVYRATGDKRHLADARLLAAPVVAALRAMPGGRVHAGYDDGDDAKEHPYVDTSFMSGNAGIGYALLRLSLLSAGPGGEAKLLPLPDQPFGAPPAPER